MYLRAARLPGAAATNVAVCGTTSSGLVRRRSTEFLIYVPDCRRGAECFWMVAHTQVCTYPALCVKLVLLFALCRERETERGDCQCPTGDDVQCEPYCVVPAPVVVVAVHIPCGPLAFGAAPACSVTYQPTQQTQRFPTVMRAFEVHQPQLHPRTCKEGALRTPHPHTCLRHARKHTAPHAAITAITAKTPADARGRRVPLVRVKAPNQVVARAGAGALRAPRKLISCMAMRTALL